MKSAFEVNGFNHNPERLDGARPQAALAVSESISMPNALKVYPNPSLGNISIEYKTDEQASLEIVNLLGQNIHSIQLQNSEGNVQLNGLETGMYLIFLRQDGIVKMHGKISVVK